MYLPCKRGYLQTTTPEVALDSTPQLSRHDSLAHLAQNILKVNEIYPPSTHTSVTYSNISIDGHSMVTMQQIKEEQARENQFEWITTLPPSVLLPIYPSIDSFPWPPLHACSTIFHVRTYIITPLPPLLPDRFSQDTSTASLNHDQNSKSVLSNLT